MRAQPYGAGQHSVVHRRRQISSIPAARTSTTKNGLPRSCIRAWPFHAVRRRKLAYRVG